ncbi:MAG: 4Fe-4S dicluster domain-containing protein [bacterium]|nr:4Fe-4S dicluster domain-containing protein [bacterium]
MKRKIIKIDEKLCNGCGLCMPNCPEGALQLIDGKARLVSDLFCDGLGACLGECPVGAITTEEREAEPYNERAVMDNIVKGGINTVKAHIKHLRDHGENAYLQQALSYLKEHDIAITESNDDSGSCSCSGTTTEDGPAAGGGCPGSKAVTLSPARKTDVNGTTEPAVSELRQWPVQLHLVNPAASYFDGADILVAADCVPFTYAAFHQRFLKNKVALIFCPKLDNSNEEYIEKLSHIFSLHDVHSVTVVHMEVPCCFGMEKIVLEALKRSEKNVILREYTITVSGDIA